MTQLVFTSPYEECCSYTVKELMFLTVIQLKSDHYLRVTISCARFSIIDAKKRKNDAFVISIQLRRE